MTSPAPGEDDGGDDDGAYKNCQSPNKQRALVVHDRGASRQFSRVFTVDFAQLKARVPRTAPGFP
jgi:hypothetical protein